MMQSALSSARMQLQQGVRGQTPATAEQRKQRLQQVIDMLVAEKETLVAAIGESAILTYATSRSSPRTNPS